MHTPFLITSRSFSSLLLLLSIWHSAWSQRPGLSPVADWINQCKSYQPFYSVRLLELLPQQEDAALEIPFASDYFSLDEKTLDALFSKSPGALVFEIPLPDQPSLHLELAQVELFAPDFTVGVKGMTQVPLKSGLFYRGIVQGQNNSLACLSVTNSGINALIALETGNYQLVKLEDGSNRYILYAEHDLPRITDFHCHADDESLQGDFDPSLPVIDRGVGCKTVNVYFECDYKLFLDKGGSVQQVTNYVASLFNQVATLYANENVGIAISQIYVWTSPDPYSNQNNIGNLLNSFRQTLGTSFNGNLAHFLTTRSLGGGIAYVDVICFKQYAFGVSCINNTFQNVPVYSWSVEVLTHELGHNLGSWHTQSCNWPKRAIDNCVSPEGSCAPGPPPVNGGTIMSYCHLTGHGINFNNGFGPLPGARIRDKVLNATCLSPTGQAPAGLSASNITGTSAALSWNPVSGATSYTVQYKVASMNQWTNAGVTTAPSFALNGLSPNTNYQWQVKTDCSAFSNTAVFTTGAGSGGSNCNAPGGLLASNITASSARLNWSGILGASQYTVQYKTNTATTWLTAGNTANTYFVLNGLNASTGYQWRVKANCSDYSTVASFVTSNTGNGNCPAPSNLTNNQVYSTSATISWAPVAGATNYTLQLKLASSTTYFTLGTVPVTSVTINGLQPSTSYHWRVKANCSFYSNTKLLSTPANLDGEGTGEALTSPGIAWETDDFIHIFPNPANSIVHLKQTAENSVNTVVQVYNVSGQVIETILWQESTLGIQTESWQNGIYWLKFIRHDRPFATQKLVVIH